MQEIDASTFHNRVDCGFTYTPVCRIQSIRMALTIAAHKHWEVRQLIVQTVFLNARVQEKVYVKTTPGYGSVDVANGRHHVMKLHKSIYGLRQSPRNWFNTINDSLKDMRFASNMSDPCVYTFDTSDTYSILTLYVDDLLLLGGHTPVLKLKCKLIERFNITDMGGASLVLRM